MIVRRECSHADEGKEKLIRVLKNRGNEGPLFFVIYYKIRCA